MSSPRTPRGWLLGPLLLIACSSGSDQVRVVRADSAGVEIVTVTPPAEPAVLWRIDSVPTIDIGANQDDPNQMFTRPLGPFRMRDGRILIGDQSAHHLRIFGPDGTWLQTVGRRGGGPGEFSSLRRLQLGSGDTIVVESAQRYLSILDDTGAFVRGFHLEAGGDALTSPTLQGVLPDGTMLMATANGSALPRESGVYRTPVAFYRYTADGAPVGTAIAESPGSARLFAISPQAISLEAFPFAARSFSLVSGSSVVVGATDLYGYEQRDVTSGAKRLVRIDLAPVPLSTETIEAEADRMLETRRGLDEPGRAALRARFVDATRQQSASVPPVDHIVASTSGDIWLAETQTDPAKPIRYLIFDSTGAWRGTATGPPRFQVSWIGTESVLGLWLDQDDVPHVREYRLLPAA